MNLQRSRQPLLQPVAPAEGVAAQPAGHAPATAAAEQPFFRFDLVRALELHRKLAIGFALAGLLLAVAYAVYAWPKYVAESQIYIQPTSDKILDQSNNPQHWPYDSNSYDSFIQQQVQLASNPDVLVSALHKLPGGSWRRSGESEQQAAGRLHGVIKVERLGSSYQVAITAQAKSAQMAADIANAVGNSIVEKAAHEANAGDTERLTILEGERDRVQNQLNADLTEQDELNKQLGMAAVGTEAPDLIDNAIGSTRNELIKARTDHDQAEARFEALGAGKGTSSLALDAEADEMIASDAGLTSMKTSLNTRRATLITQMANLTPNNPEYKLDAEELSKINSSLDVMMRDLRATAAARIQQKLKTDLESTSAVEAQLNSQLRQLAATAASATPKLQRANDLATDIGRLRTRFAAVDEALHDIQLQDSVPGAVHLSVAAVPPLHPSLTGILRKAVPLALGGLLLGLLAALLATQLDPRIYIGSDVEHLLGFAPMISLPDCDEVPEAVFEEHILRLSTAIEHARKQGSLRTCIFTGSGAGTGVTTVVTRVRDMLSSMGRSTVLVNATGTAQPAAHASQQKFDPPPAEPGTRSQALLQRVTQGTKIHDESLVLTDTAPLLISAETEYLARFVDCAVVVVESGATTRAELRATADALQRLNVSAVGLVLNRVKLDKADAAFRKSIRGLETHLRLQGRADQKAAPRAHHFAEEMPAAVVPTETIRPVTHEQPIAVSPQEPASPEPDVKVEQILAEQEQPLPRTEPAAQQQAVTHLPFNPVQHREEPAAMVPDEQPKIAQVEPEREPDQVAEGGLMAEQSENQQTIADYRTPRNAGSPMQEDAAEETIVSIDAVPRNAGHHQRRAPIQEQTHPSLKPEYDATPEHIPSEYARSEYQVYVPERATLSQAARDPFARHGIKPAAASNETVWPAPSMAAEPLQRANGIPQAHDPAAPAPDPDLPWWLSEAPLTTADLAADAIQAGIASKQERTRPPVSDEPVRLPASRLSGLRNVIFGTGSRGLRKRQAEKNGSENRTEPVLEQQAESPVEPALSEIRPASEFWPASKPLQQLYQAPPPQVPAPAPTVFETRHIEAAAPEVESQPLPEPVLAPIYPRAQQPALLEANPHQTVVAHEMPEVISAPEFLPPQPIATPRNRPDSWESEAKQLDRGDTMDDMPLLPSRRGQYRRKR